MGKSDLGAGYRHRILHAAAMFDRDEVFDAFISLGGNRRDQLERLCPSRHGGKPGAWRSPCAHTRHCQPRLSSQGATPPNSRLSTAKFAAVFGWQAPEWRSSVEALVQDLPIG